MSHVVPYPLARLRGNPGKRKIEPEPEPEQPAQIPEPPEFLNDLAKQEWWRIAKQLQVLRLFTSLDMKVLAAYCAACARWETAEAAIKKQAQLDQQSGGLVVESRDGSSMNPLVRVSAAASRDMMRFAREFGISPAARARIAQGVSGRRKSKFDGLLVT